MKCFQIFLGAIGTNRIAISGVQLKTRISYQHLKKYLTYLVQIKLIIYEREEKKFRITQQGLHALDIYAKLDELLVQNISYKVITITSFPVTTTTFATLLYVISYLLNMHQERIALL
jgi:predicted transcriptional regulator